MRRYYARRVPGHVVPACLVSSSSGVANGMDIKHLEPGRRLELYVSPDCPYCREARAYFDRIAYPYEAYDAQNVRARRDEMFAHTNGNPTVPAILVDGVYVQSGWGDPPRG